MSKKYALSTFSNRYFQDLNNLDSVQWTYDGVDRYATGAALYEEGCWVNGVQNCTEMCGNSQLIWAADAKGQLSSNLSANVGNCAAYAVVAALLEHASHDIYNAEIADRFVIRKESEIDIASITFATNRCLSTFCTTSDDACACAPGDDACTKSPNTTVSFGSFNVTVPTYSKSLCASIEPEINPDIAGIGISVAYLTAAVLLFVIYLNLRVCRVLKYLAPAFYFLPGPWHRDAWHDACARASDLQRSVTMSEHNANLVTLLADFQKGQCMFWLSIDMAVLIGVYGGTSVKTLGARNVGDFIFNLGLLKMVCTCGYLFTAFGLYCLHYVSQRSWYVFSLSFVTTLCSGFAWGATFFAKITRVTPDDAPPSLHGYCGPLDPKVYCGSSGGIYDWISASQVDSISIGVGGVCMFVLLGDIVVHSTWSQGSRMTNFLCTCRGKNSRIRSILITTSRVIAELFFLGLWATLFTALIFLAFGYGETGWGFGQIIALTIWLPFVLEWIYATLLGFDKASQHRVALPWVVQRIDAKPSVDDKRQYIQLHDNPNKEHDVVGTDIKNPSYGGLRPLHMGLPQPIHGSTSSKDKIKTSIVEREEDENHLFSAQT